MQILYCTICNLNPFVQLNEFPIIIRRFTISYTFVRGYLFQNGQKLKKMKYQLGPNNAKHNLTVCGVFIPKDYSNFYISFNPKSNLTSSKCILLGKIIELDNHNDTK